MSEAFKRSVAAMVVVVFVVGCSPNADRVKATVTTIDRTCNFIETTTSPDGRKTARGLTDSCNSTGEWASVKEKRNKRVSGKATVHFSYTAPADGSYQSGKFELTGRDDLFYEIKAGDEVEILVSKTDPTKFRRA